MSLLGAVYGTLLVNTGKSLFSETFPQLWLFAMGGLFIAVVMFFPERPGRRLGAASQRSRAEAVHPPRRTGRGCPGRLIFCKPETEL